jgi:hypothetical protein
MIDLDPATGQSASDPHSSAKHTFLVERLLIVVISLAMVILPVVEVLARKIRGQGVPGSNAYEQHSRRQRPASTSAWRRRRSCARATFCVASPAISAARSRR